MKRSIITSLIFGMFATTAQQGYGYTIITETAADGTTTTTWSDKSDISIPEGAQSTTPSTLPGQYTYYNDANDAIAHKNERLIWDLGDTRTGNVYEAGGFYISNGYVNEDGSGNAAKNSAYAADTPASDPPTYTYGYLQLTDNSYVRLGNRSNSLDYIGSLELGDNARLILGQEESGNKRQFCVTGKPYTTMGKEAQIDLINGAELSIGASNQSYWDAVVLKGANQGDGHICNTSDTVAELGTASAGSIEFRKLHVQVNGNTDTTIAAKLGDVNLNNATNGNIVTITGGTAEGFSRSIRNLATGTGKEADPGGVTLLNRGDSILLDHLYIGENNTVSAKQGDENSNSAIIRISAYDSALGNTDETDSASGVNGLQALNNAQIDADLELGIRDPAQCVILVTDVALTDDYRLFEYGKTDREAGYGIDMCGNDVTLLGNTLTYAALYIDYYHQDGVEDEILLFTNADSLTLGDKTYDNEYIYMVDEVEAAEYFSSETTDSPYWYTSIAAAEGEKGNKEGWFIEYRDNQDGTGDVYLAYKTAKDTTVPEPTTATLSLLALAALSARRRRRD